MSQASGSCMCGVCHGLALVERALEADDWDWRKKGQ